jgi:hypothetical protein
MSPSRTEVPTELTLDTSGSTAIWTIPVGETTCSPEFFIFTREMLIEKWTERQQDRLATGARYWRRRRLPVWLRERMP